MNLIQNTPPGDAQQLQTKFELGPVRAWSFSSLQVFEECPYRTYISRVKKIREPQGEAAARGERIHKQAEDFTQGVVDEFPKDKWHRFESELYELKALYDAGKAEFEGEWGFTKDWEPCGWMAPETWARIKLDAYVQETETSARVIDYKSGKRRGNEIKHNQQCLLYAIAAFVRNPNLQFVTAELWYVDLGETSKKSYTREQALSFLPGFHKRAVAQTTEVNFDPTPSKHACRWCSYKDGEYPECKYGVR